MKPKHYFSISFILFFLITGTQLKAQLRNYGDDVAETIQQQYHFYYQKDGVVVYSAAVTSGGKSVAVCLKVVNNNSYSVIVTWGGPKWYANGVYIDPIQNPGAPPQLGYSDNFAAGETKDGIYYRPGGNATEVYDFRPNYLYYTAPQKQWVNSQLSYSLEAFQVIRK
ncbi:MAG TPA: hypothetical protein VK718_10635 [Ferruginibacter sp.]|jgi:hypothetical protein|nr:hypothetical protein [Ferruginibacter sp.]